MWQKFKDGFRGFMSGRYGSDQLNMTLLIGGLVVSLFSSFIGSLLLSYLGMAAYIWALVRTMSRNIEKRRAENAKFVDFRNNFKSNASQFFARLKNAKKFKYFRCPQCKSRLRLPRKVGEVTVTCGKCHHQFKQKA